MVPRTHKFCSCVTGRRLESRSDSSCARFGELPCWRNAQGYRVSRFPELGFVKRLLCSAIHPEGPRNWGPNSDETFVNAGTVGLRWNGETFRKG